MTDPAPPRPRRPFRRAARRFLLLAGVAGSSLLAFAPLATRGSADGGRVAQVVSSSRERLRNGDFEESGAWFPDPGGFEWAAGEGREGATAIVPTEPVDWSSKIGFQVCP